MRVLVLGDIHSNGPALAAVAEAAGAFDACLVTGDLVDYGGDPVAVLRWVRRHATAGVRGNHDHAVAQRVPVKSGSGLKSLAAATRPLHWQLLGREEMKFLARLPVTCRLGLGGRTYFLVHGTPRDPLDEYLGDDPVGWAARLALVEADFVLVGHTHVQFVLEVETPAGDAGKPPQSKIVLNPGSVGQPRDGDPRAAFAVVEDGKVTLRRVEYDVDAAIASLVAGGLRDEPLAAAERLLRTGKAG